MCNLFTFIIVGEINWQEGIAQHDDVQNLLLNTFITRGFEQFVTESTRSEHILDVILFNQPTMYNCC